MTIKVYCRWFWIVLAGFVGGCRWFWLVPCFSNYGHSAHFMSFCVLTFVFAAFCCKILETHQQFWFLCFHSCWCFQGSRFLIPSQQRNHRKSFYCHGKYFATENLHAPSWTSAKFYCRNKMGNPKQVASLHLACLCSQSQHRIWFILLTHRANQICQ